MSKFGTNVSGEVIIYNNDGHPFYINKFECNTPEELSQAMQTIAEHLGYKVEKLEQPERFVIGCKALNSKSDFWYWCGYPDATDRYAFHIHYDPYIFTNMSDAKLFIKNRRLEFPITDEHTYMILSEKEYNKIIEYQKTIKNEIEVKPLQEKPDYWY